MESMALGHVRWERMACTVTSDTLGHLIGCLKDIQNSSKWQQRHEARVAHVSDTLRSPVSKFMAEAAQGLCPNRTMDNTQLLSKAKESVAAIQLLCSCPSCCRN